MDIKNIESIFYTDLNFPRELCRNYVKCIREAQITLYDLSVMDRHDLKEIGINSLGHQLSIMLFAERKYEEVPYLPPLPKLNSVNVTNKDQWRKFMHDWKLYLKLTPPKFIRKKEWRLLDCCDENLLEELRKSRVDITNYQELIEQIKRIILRQTGEKPQSTVVTHTGENTVNVPAMKDMS